MKQRILIIIGTRPEAIKLAPLILHLRDQPNHFDPRVCLTNQHPHLVQPVLDFFKIKVDLQLPVPLPNGDLLQLSADLLAGFAALGTQLKADWVIVQGDTTSALLGGLAAFYQQSRLLHLEAGLRTFDKFAPFPEEINRKLLSVLADYHAAPSEDARLNLIAEGVAQERIFVCGNTAIDALQRSSQIVAAADPITVRQLASQLSEFRPKKWILSTIHRRENRGDKLSDILAAMYQISRREEVHVIHILHPNPEVHNPIRRALEEADSISLLPPQSYDCFVWLMQQCYCLLTDSGGIQEEAPSLQKPVVILREKTERPLILERNAGILVGSNKERIIAVLNRLLEDEVFYRSLQVRENPFGDGKASERVVNFLRENPGGL